MNLTVTEDAKGKSKIINVDISAVNFIQFDGYKRMLEVHTTERMYYMPGSLTYWIDALSKSEGVYFEKVDRNSLVNMNRIVSIDSILKVAYFEEVVNEKSKGCPLAWYNFNKLSTLMISTNPQLVIR